MPASDDDTGTSTFQRLKDAARQELRLRGAPLHPALLVHPGDQITFAMIKSHVAKRPDVAGRVIGTILDQGWTILCMLQTELNREQVHALYQEHAGRPYMPDLVASVSDQVILMALQGPAIITMWRQLLGATDSLKANAGTLRAMWGSRYKVADNVAHGSDSEPAARRELAIFFPRQINLWG